MGSSSAASAPVHHQLSTTLGRIHAIEQGSGPALIFVHGMPTSAALWRHVMAHLAADHRCIAVDLPGFGTSDRPPGFDYAPQAMAAALAEVIAALDISGYGLVAQDWGGPVGVGAALAAPGELAFLALGSTFLWPPGRGLGRLFNRALSTPPARWWLRHSPAIVNILLRVGTRRRLSGDDLVRYRGPMADPADRAALLALPAQLETARPWFSQIERQVIDELSAVPILLTWPTRDPANPMSHAQRLRDMFDVGELVRLDAGHFYSEDRPDELASAIKDFARRHDFC